MKTDISKGDTYLLIDEVPVDAYDIQIAEDDDPQYVLIWLTPGITPQGRLFLPAGKWQKVGFGNEISEDQWKGIVPEMTVGARWPNYSGDYPIWFYSAKEAGKSWIRSHGMKPETCLVLKKVK